MATEFPSLGWAAIDWIEHYLVHGPGDVQGKPIELDDEFAAFIVKAYRVRPRTGERVVRRAFLSRAKGRAKSELAGMVECFEALGPARFDHWAEAGEVSDWGYAYEEGEPVGAPLAYVEILNVATEEGQAGNTYDNTYYMLHPDTCSPELRADYGKIDVGLTRITLPDRRGFMEPVTASNDSKDGGKSTFIVADETHLWTPPTTKDAKFKLGLMHQTMARNLLKRKAASGWMLETSTMYAAGERSVAEGTHAYAKSPAAKDGKLLFDHRQASDGYDFTKRSDRVKALREAYGPAAAWMPLGEIADSYDDPQVSPREWERYWTNRPVPLVEQDTGRGDLPYEAWLELATRERDRGTGVVFGLDLTGERDVWVGVGWVRDDGHAVLTLANDGAPLPAHRVVAECRRLQETWGGVIATSAFLEELENEGLSTQAVNGPDFAAACGALEDRIIAGTVHHHDQAALNEAIRTARWRPQLGSGERALLLKGMPEVGPAAAVTRVLHGLVMAAQYDPLDSVY